MRALIAMMKHETNTFSPIVTDLARFEAWGLHFGEAARRAYAGTAMPMGAYMELAEAAGADIVTPVAAEAMPSGPVAVDAYERLAEAICDAVRDGCDVALLDLHGAMVAEHTMDGEGTLLERMRAIDPDLPIAVTLDLHCNLTEKMVTNCTALIGYKTYPHTDMYAVGKQIGQVVFDSIAGRVTPTMAWGNVPLLSQTLCQGTDDEPMKGLIAACRDCEAQAGVLAATVFGGFALADMPESGNSAIVVSDGDADLARDCRDRLLAQAWAQRAAFVYQHRPLGDTVAGRQGDHRRAGRAAQSRRQLRLRRYTGCNGGNRRGDRAGARRRRRRRGLGSGRGAGNAGRRHRRGRDPQFGRQDRHAVH